MNDDKPHPIEQPMDYDIVEDLKKVKANVPLFEMCKVSQQKERNHLYYEMRTIYYERELYP